MGATCDADRSLGGVNAWGNSFPAEEIPFGRELCVGGIPFWLPGKRGPADHVETIGQIIEFVTALPVQGIALLCFGEMGDQESEITIVFDDSTRQQFSVVAKGWLISGNSVGDPDCFSCSHLHYPGGYELTSLRPSLWCRRINWQPPAIIKRMCLGDNPLFHIFAATCIHA
jgi:hypothetical protein